jgi:Family of unknown function (DUF6263)
MKKIFISALALTLTLGLVAQSYTPAVKLEAGKQYTITTITKSNMTQEAMGQTMEIPIDATNKATLTIKAASDRGYESTYITDRVQFAANMMGQEMNYDSDKKEDRDGKMGENMNKLVGKETSFVVNGAGNIIKETIVKPTQEKSEDEGQDMMSGLMSMGLSAASTCPAFNLFVNNTELKIGDSFVDSSTVNDKDGSTKTSTTYVLKEIKEGKSIFALNGQMALTKKMEAQGMEMTTTTSSKSTGDMIVDVATGLLVSKSIVTETTGNIEVSGMTIPITGKTTSTITVSAK